MGDMEEKGAVRLLYMMINKLKIKVFYFYVSR